MTENPNADHLSFLPVWIENLGRGLEKALRVFADDCPFGGQETPCLESLGRWWYSA